jgi:glycosyltransferase involved in cell wall biosynthesis
MREYIDMNLWIVSNCRPNSGWGTYVNNLHDAMGDNAKYLNLFGSNNLEKCAGDTAIIPGTSRLRPFVARGMPKLYFHGLINSIKNERKNGLIVHYAYHLLPLIGDKNIDIVTIHDVIFLSKWFTDRPMVRNLYSKRLLKGYLNYEHIITVSNSIKKQLMSISERSDIEVIHHPCPTSFRSFTVLDSDKRKLKLPTDKILILSTSNNKPWKNLPMISRVMQKLGDKFVLIRVGPGIDTGITFMQVDQTTLNLLYNSCHLLLFPSLEEGFGFPILEAMKTGLPAVVSDIEVFHEIGSDAVEYVNPQDADSIVAGIFRAIDRAEKMRELGFRRSALYTEEIFRKKMLSYYERVANSSSANH